MTIATDTRDALEQLEPAEKYTDRLAAVLADQCFASKGGRTRFRLKLAAAICLEYSGFQDLKVSDVCEKAGLALGTFYVYFDDKAEIATELLLEFADYLYQNAQRCGRGHTDYESILFTNQYFLAAYQANSGLVRCFFQLEDQVPEFRESWRARRLQWTEGLARSMSKRLADADVMRPIYLEMAFALEGMVWHYFYDVFVRRDAFAGHGAERADEVAELLSVLWYRAVYCEDPPAEKIVHVRELLDLGRASPAAKAGRLQSVL